MHPGRYHVPPAFPFRWLKEFSDRHSRFPRDPVLTQADAVHLAGGHGAAEYPADLRGHFDFRHVFPDAPGQHRTALDPPSSGRVRGAVWDSRGRCSSPDQPVAQAGCAFLSCCRQFYPSGFAAHSPFRIPGCSAGASVPCGPIPPVCTSLPRGRGRRP